MGAGRDEYSDHPHNTEDGPEEFARGPLSLGSGGKVIATIPPPRPERGGDHVRFYRAVVEERDDWFSRTGSLHGNAVGQGAGPWR